MCCGCLNFESPRVCFDLQLRDSNAKHSGCCQMCLTFSDWGIAGKFPCQNPESNVISRVICVKIIWAVTLFWTVYSLLLRSLEELAVSKCQIGVKLLTINVGKWWKVSPGGRHTSRTDVKNLILQIEREWLEMIENQRHGSGWCCLESGYAAKRTQRSYIQCFLTRYNLVIMPMTVYSARHRWAWILDIPAWEIRYQRE